MNTIDAMTVDECRDELATMQGYAFGITKLVSYKHWYTPRHIDVELDWPFNGDDGLPDHPIPDTLDEAAKLPEGWQNLYITTDSSGWFASAIRLGDPKGRNDINATGITELEARFRLRVAIERKLFPKETSEY